MANFFSDIAGGFLGQGPGTESVSGYETLPTEKRQSLDLLRSYLAETSSKDYEALPKGDITKRVGRVRGAYQEMFNPFLKNLQSGIDADLSRSGLLTSTRSAALRGQTLGQLAVQSALPTAELENALEEQNRMDIWNRRMQILGMGLGTNYPGQVEFDKPMSLERAYGGFLGKGAGLALSAALAPATGGMSLLAAPALMSGGGPTGGTARGGGGGMMRQMR